LWDVHRLEKSLGGCHADSRRMAEEVGATSGERPPSFRRLR
jgi:hypothetical protein